MLSLAVGLEAALIKKGTLHLSYSCICLTLTACFNIIKALLQKFAVCPIVHLTY